MCEEIKTTIVWRKTVGRKNWKRSALKTEKCFQTDWLTLTGKQEQFGATRSALYGSLHQRRETELVALVDVDVTEMPQQEINGVIMS